MTNVAQALAEGLIELLYRLENANDNDVNPDFAVELMENAAAGLQACPEATRVDLRALLKQLAAEESDAEKRAFMLMLPDTMGLD